MKLIRRPLAAVIAAAFALATPLAYSNSVVVTNCNDAGSGSLRNAISVAHTADIVDMSVLKNSDLGCSASTITLKTGAISVPQNDLIVIGPGVNNLTVTGQTIPASGTPTVEHDRIFTHIGTGTLLLGNFSISHGYLSTSGYALGGCIYSKGSVQLVSTNVTDCYAHSSDKSALGGALFTTGETQALSSNVSRNSVSAVGENSFAAGGAILSEGNLIMQYSTVAGNSAVCAKDNEYQSFGGGIYIQGANTTIAESTISNNSSCNAAGSHIHSTATTIVNSTIAENQAKRGNFGGAAVYSDSVSISNSTIAFNRSADIGSGDSSALDLRATTVALNSNIVSNNVAGSGLPNDISIYPLTNSVSVSGEKNLVFAPNASLPNDTIVGSCPLLGKLRDNGGLTDTIALQSRSPAIDTGFNKFGTSLPYDQRGMPFVRTSGVAPDIGAYEINQADVVFTANFEGCP